MPPRNFGADLNFLNQHVDTILLSKNEAQLAVVPAWQGRTMTSTARGTGGNSYGWINYDLIESGRHDPQVNLYGGEDRFWLSPEGGQFSIFFEPESPMEFHRWRTPALLDTEPFELSEQTECSATFTQKGSVTNYSRFEFQMKFDRRVEILDLAEIERGLGSSVSGLAVVGHESQNSLTNIGPQPWTQQNGLLGIWMLCMNKPSPKATIVVPFKRGPIEELGPIVNADYFGKLDDTRLRVDEDKGLIFFKGDGKLRSKLGLTFSRAEPNLGCWDGALNGLTVVQFNLPEQAPSGYTNNLWEVQENPFAGDVINSYNDGPNESGGMLGPFYELETLSPALGLGLGESYLHRHRTIHLEGPQEKLDQVCQDVFGTDLATVESQFS